MAAKESVNIDQLQVEKVVNRWLVEYYFSLTVEFFKNQQYADFCAIRDVLDNVLERPIENVDDMPLKIRLLQFLSRINEGEKLDSWFEPDQTKTPLESALNLLESMKANFQIPQADFDYVSTLLKEMILGIFIKNEVFDKAKAALTLYFPSPENDKRATFMRLICQKSNTHKVIDQINFPQFRKEMLRFCQKLCPFTVPFLHKAALSLVESRIEVQHDGAVKSDEQDEASPSSSPPSSPQVNLFQFRSRRYPFIQKSRLEVAYKALAQCLEEKTFSDLEEEVEEEYQKRVCLCLERHTDSIRGATQSSEQEALFQRKSVSPMEASPADQMTQTGAERQAAAGPISKTLYTVARFVVEPDSQPSSQCTTTAEELDVETRTTESPQMPSASNKELNGPQCSDSDRKPSRPKRKLPMGGSSTVSRASTSFIECSSDNEGESPQSGKKELERLNESSNKKANRSRGASENRDEQQEYTDVSKTPKKRPLKSKSPKKCDLSSGEHACLSNSSLDMSPGGSPPHPVPQKSSTPHKDALRKIPVIRLWREGHKNITEEKDTWIDEDSLFPSIKNRGSGSNESTISHSGHRRRWTESETENLIQGVKKFGEGNWSKIKAYYSFNNRSNVNLKDRWRTMKKQKLI